MAGKVRLERFAHGVFTPVHEEKTRNGFDDHTAFGVWLYPRDDPLSVLWMMDVIADFESGNWDILFPKLAHRPAGFCLVV